MVDEKTPTTWGALIPFKDAESRSLAFGELSVQLKEQMGAIDDVGGTSRSVVGLFVVPKRPGQQAAKDLARRLTEMGYAALASEEPW